MAILRTVTARTAIGQSKDPSAGKPPPVTRASDMVGDKSNHAEPAPSGPQHERRRGCLTRCRRGRRSGRQAAVSPCAGQMKRRPAYGHEVRIPWDEAMKAKPRSDVETEVPSQ
jgi:hypothetical protein